MFDFLFDLVAWGIFIAIFGGIGYFIIQALISNHKVNKEYKENSAANMSLEEIRKNLNVTNTSTPYVDELQEKRERKMYESKQYWLDHQDPSQKDKKEYGAVRKDRYGNLYDGAGGVIDKSAVELKKMQKQMKMQEDLRKAEEKRIRNQEYYWGNK